MAMAERNQGKAERRQAAEHLSKAERKEAKLRRKQRRRAEDQATQAAGSVDSASGDAIELRLVRLEETVNAQAELSRQLLEKLDEVLEATHTADPQP
jgi:hypothetical protein